MSVLCQIALVSDERQFMEHVRKHGRPPMGAGGWGRFYSEVPAIGTTLQIDWSDYEFKNQTPLPSAYETWKDRKPDYFRVIHHHRHLIPKPEYFCVSSDEINRALNTGHHSISVCTVYVVQAEVSPQ